MKFFLAALGLALILEAVPYFLFPEKMREFFRKIPEIPVSSLRILGFIFLVLGLLLVYVSTSRAGTDSPSIRISIQKSRGPVEIRGRDLVVRKLPSYQEVRLDRAGSSVVFSPEASGIRVNEKKLSTGHLLLSSSDGEIQMEGRKFQGRVEVVKIKGNQLLLINDMDLERYLVGLINHEISSSWPMEAVKAQAVAARTYAYFQKGQKLKELYDLESSVLDQVYGGVGLEDARAASAVRATRGEILTYRGEVIKSVYHSCCGGKTENSEAVWGQPLPYLRSVPDPYCTQATHYYWRYSISADKLSRRLGGGSLREVTIRGRTPSGRVREVEFAFNPRNRLSFSGNELRKILGYEKVRSTNFEIVSEGNYLKFIGSGSGHGVGMCQWGAKGMAEKGYNYRQILKHFYRGVEIKRLY